MKKINVNTYILTVRFNHSKSETELNIVLAKGVKNRNFKMLSLL